MAVFSILVTAPVGAWAIPTFAPKLLDRGEVDPTKVSVSRRIILLAAVDTSLLAAQVLAKVAELARRSDAEVVVMHVIQMDDSQGLERLRTQTQRILADIRYRFITGSGTVPEAIVRAAQDYGVAEIVIGKRGYRPLDKVLIGSVSQAVLESSTIPVVVVEAELASP
ncbi:MAG TPA: universal stress protein [Coleofasciculaceae cyanobacterium]|jgi:nucleotide-binding universal stress UspA family protein